MALFYLILLLFLAFQPVFGGVIPIFNYLDEGIAVFSVIAFLMDFLKHGKMRKKDLVTIFLLMFFVFIGIWGNRKSDLAFGNIAILEDILAFTKLYLVYLMFSHINVSEKTKEKLGSYIFKISAGLAVLMFSCALITQVFNFGMGHDPRHGLLSFRFIFENAPALNSFFYFFMPLFSCVIYRNGKFRKHATLIAIMLATSWFLTLRSRAMVFSIIYLVVYFFIFNKPKKIESISIKKRYFICGMVAAVLMGWDTFLHYFVNNEREVRFIMSRMCLVLAEKFFPLGSGFATFGSEASRKYYSSAYSMLGISNIWGISQDTGASFVLDQFWFGVIGQFGVIGLAVVIVLVFRMYKDIWLKSKSNKGFQLAAITFIFTTFLGSISAATYINSYALATVLALYILI